MTDITQQMPSTRSPNMAWSLLRAGVVARLAIATALVLVFWLAVLMAVR